VCPTRLEHDRALAERAPQREARDELSALDCLYGVRRREVGRPRDPERDDARGGGGAAPIVRVRIVGIDDGCGVRSEPRHHLSLAASHAVEIAETLEMLGAGVGDEADRRTRETHQLGHLADAIGADLDHGASMRRLQAQERHRHADMIVEVAVGRHARTPARENRRRHFLGGGLAVATADADDGNRERRTPRRGQPLQGDERVGHRDLGDRRTGRRLLDQRTHGAALRRRGDELAAVERRTSQRDEQRPRRERTAVRGHGAERPVLADQRAPDRPSRLLQRALHAAAPRIFKASSRSLKLRRDAP
jgi:hypothetical protein